MDLIVTQADLQSHYLLNSKWQLEHWFPTSGQDLDFQGVEKAWCGWLEKLSTIILEASFEQTSAAILKRRVVSENRNWERI